MSQVDAYFSRFHFLMPVIDKLSFVRRYAYIMANLGDKKIAAEQTAFLALVNAVFACAAKQVDDPRLSSGEGLDESGMGMIYYERCVLIGVVIEKCRADNSTQGLDTSLHLPFDHAR